MDPGGGPKVDKLCMPPARGLWLTRVVIRDEENSTSGSWSRLTSTSVFRSPWFEARRDTAVRPDGSTGIYDHIVTTGSVTVLAIDDEGAVAVTRQWIYTHEGTQWRLPAGRIEPGDPGAEVSARRELLEETGISARHWRHLGTINCADSFTNHRDHVFLAIDLRHGTPNLEPGEADLEVRLLPFDQVLSLVIEGEMPHAGSSYALLTARTLGLA
jgi:ADP-ribose pyrophosphatase